MTLSLDQFPAEIFPRSIRGQECTHIVFHSGVEVPLAEACAHYDRALASGRGFDRVVGAIIREDNGRSFRTSAKEWSLWSPMLGQHVLARIGTGAYGDTIVVERSRKQLRTLNPEAR